MSYLNYQTQNRLRCFIQIHSILWCSGLLLLNGGMAIAQTSTEDAIDPVTSPSAAVEPSPITPPASIQSTSPVPASEFVQPVAPTSNNLSKSDNLGASNNTYIDSTSYDVGATNRSGQSATASQRDRTPSTLSISGNPKYRGTGEFPALKPPIAYSGGTTASGQSYLRSFRLPINRNIGNIRLIFPLSIPSPITSLFGWRIHPISGVLRFHSGTDMGAPLGTPVLAAYAGRVAIADFLSGYGLSVALQHQKSTQETLYAHLSEIFVKPGQWVKQGDLIGRVGQTGTATGPNLHFELRQSTSDGWVATDANSSLEYALVEFTKALQNNPVASIKNSSTKSKSHLDRQQQPSMDWSSMDAGTKLEYILNQLISVLERDQSTPPSQS